MAKCIICDRNIYSGMASRCADDGYVCDECLGKYFDIKPDFLFRKQSEVDALLKNNSEEIQKIFKDGNAEELKKQEQIAEEKRIKEEETERQLKELEKLKENSHNVVVTTCDLHRDYEVIGPVYIQINNRSNQFSTLKKKHLDHLQELKDIGQGSNDQMSGLEVLELLFLNGGAYNGHTNFDDAFFIAVEELKEKAALLKADAVIGMRQDIDLDSNGFQYFYLQMYGTAVRYLD